MVRPLSTLCPRPQTLGEQMTWRMTWRTTWPQAGGPLQAFLPEEPSPPSRCLQSPLPLSARTWLMVPLMWQWFPQTLQVHLWGVWGAGDHDTLTTTSV